MKAWELQQKSHTGSFVWVLVFLELHNYSLRSLQLSEEVSETEGRQGEIMHEPGRKVKINDGSLHNIVLAMQKLCFLVELSNGGFQ